MSALEGDCPGCIHHPVQHFRSPSCLMCRCNLDPKCSNCGQLSSKHDDDYTCPCRCIAAGSGGVHYPSDPTRPTPPGVTDSTENTGTVTP